jgi:peptide/nickel transport system permease protein
MGQYVARRLAQAVLVVFGVVTAVFFLLQLTGDPVRLMIGESASEADIENIRHQLGLDRPLPERYVSFLAGAARADFGQSVRQQGRPAMEIVLDRYPATLRLAFLALCLSVVLATVFGVISAVRRYSLLDNVVMVTALFGQSMPNFWLGIMLILVFAVQLGWLPPGGATTIGVGGSVDRADHLVLPVITLTLVNFGPQLRYMRAAMIDTLNHDYIRTARAKGAGETRILTRHALRNALIPLITVVALSFGSLFSGALVTETMFSYPGMGKLIYDAVLGNDYNLALAGLLFATLMTLLANFAADLAYAAVDPRIAYR